LQLPNLPSIPYRGPSGPSLHPGGRKAILLFRRQIHSEVPQ
ncbi:hypothetical protein AJOOGB_AJOOGB_05015, partial [Dysosmobacter welbionis]